MLSLGRRGPRPAVGFNTNLDNIAGSWNSTGRAYYDGILGNDLFAAGSPFLTHIREAVLKNGIAPTTVGVDGGTPPDILPFTRILELPFVTSFSAGVLCNANIERVAPYIMPAGEHQTPPILDDANVWGPRKEYEVRWKLACIANTFPDCRGPRGIWGWLGPNEPDFNPWRFQQLYNDENWEAGGPAQTLALDRVVLLATWMEAELRSDRWWTKQRHPGIIFMPATSSQALKIGSWTGWTAKQMYTHQNGKMIGLVDAITTTWHHTQSTFERGVPGSVNRISAYWLWDALKNAQTIWEASGKGPAPQLPVCATEYGVDFEDRMPVSGYYSTEIGRKYIKCYRLGLAACARFFWALPMVIVYSITGSGANGQNFYTKDLPVTVREPETSVMRQVFNDQKYMLNGPQPWNLPITAKTWQEIDGQEMTSGFHRGYTWAVAAPLYNVPAGNLVSTDPPMPNWLNVTIDDNLITSLPSTPAFVQAFVRPVILPDHGTYRVIAEVMVSGGGRISLVARGYNLLNGFAEAAAVSASSGWVPLAVTFTTLPHKVPKLPNRAQACIMLEHNGVGTAQFRNVSVSRV